MNEGKQGATSTSTTKRADAPQNSIAITINGSRGDGRLLDPV
jgi:hypothetical protein